MSNKRDKQKRRGYSPHAVEQLLETGGGLLAELAADTDAEVDEALVERWLGSRIGPFRVLEFIDGGGMAQVFRAERDDGQFEQVVAIKVLRTSLSADLSERFAAESRLLGKLKHPGIAQIIDGGMAHGDPWIAMEFVDGQPLDAYCNEKRLTVEERLAAFLCVADAVQHAHSRLIVHRDIKPSNVLVSHDGRPILLDFGIAKTLSEQLSADDPPALSLLTPQYATPEQVSGEPAGVASDIYQLGLLLYTLLTDRLAQGMEHSSIEVMKKIVIEHAPISPSKQIGKLRAEDKALARSVAEARKTRSASLEKKLQGDLDAIVGKSLEKDPDRRYRSVTALVDDVKAFLDCRPVQARSPGLLYRSERFARRHRGGVIAGVLTFVVVFTALTMVALSWRSALNAQTQALAEARRSQQVGEFLGQMLERSNPWFGGSERATTRGLLDASRDDIDSLVDQPDVQAELLTRFGAAYRSMGAYEDSIEAYGDGIELWRALGEMDPVVTGLTQLAFISLQLNRIEAGQQYLREARTIATQTPGLLPESRGYLSLVEAINTGMNGEFDAQLATLESVIAELEGETSVQAARVREAATMRMIPNAMYVSDLGRLESLIDEIDSSHQLRTDTAPAAAVILLQHKMRYWQMRGGLTVAERYGKEALQQLRKIFGPDHARTAFAETDVAMLLLDHGKLDEADDYFQPGLERLRKVYAADPTSEQHLIDAHRLAALGQFDSARTEIEAAGSAAATELDRTLVELSEAMLMVDEHRFAEAGDAFERVLPKAIETSHRHHGPVLEARIARARSLFETGQLDAAETAYQSLLDESAAHQPHGLPGETMMLTGLARVALRRNDPGRAGDLVDRARAQMLAIDASMTPQLFDVLLLQGEVLSATGPAASQAVLDTLKAEAAELRSSRSIQQQYRLTRLSALLAAAGETTFARDLCAGASASMKEVLATTHPLMVAATTRCDTTRTGR